MQTFTETQRFRQWWLWAVIALCTIVPVGLLLAEGFQSLDIVPLTIPLAIAVVMYMIRLDTQVDQAGIRYRFFPLTGWRTFPWDKIQRATVQTYPFVGYGIRWDFDGWYYNINGQWGLHIDRGTGKCLVIGTQRPEELRQFLSNIHPVISE